VRIIHKKAIPPTEALRAVVAAARTGSFTAAAETMNITHGAVSRRIAAVEQWAGFPLFRRIGRGVSVTLRGQWLVTRIEQSFALLEDGVLLSDEEAELPVIRVGVVQSFARLWLLPNLAALEGDPPDLRLESEIDNRYMTLSDARIAIRYGQGNWPGLHAEPLFREHFCAIASQSIAMELGPDPSIEMILKWPLLHDLTQDAWQNWLAVHGQDYRRGSKDRFFDGHDLVLQACALGLGIGLARMPYGKAHIEREGLVVLGHEGAPGPNCFHIVTQAGNRNDFVERLIGRMRNLAGR